MNPSPEIIQLALNFESKLKDDIAKIEEQVTRIKSTYVNLKNSHVKQVRLMIGDYSPVLICDTIYPIKDIKKEYLERLLHRLRVLETKLLEMKENYKKLTHHEDYPKKRKVLHSA
jgi:hypothetical protein